MSITVLLWPSTRALAYLEQFKSQGIQPTEILFLDTGYRVPSELIKEANAWNYKRYIDFSIDPLEQATDVLGRSPVILKSDNINSASVCEAIQSVGGEFVFYTGGGIVGADLINSGKKFIHVHPGIIPARRGSTCFYYSLLEDYSVGATAFVMDENLDTGAIILKRNFRPNYQIADRQKLFLDYVLDNYLRATMVPDVLTQISMPSKRERWAKPVCTEPPYFRIHPVLRGLAAKKLNALYVPELPEGLHEID